MAIIKTVEPYREIQSYTSHTTIGGGYFNTRAYPDITPAKFCVISGDHNELLEIAEWVTSNDIQGAISVTDSVDGVNHTFTVTMYNKEAIVLFMLIWE